MPAGRLAITLSLLVGLGACTSTAPAGSESASAHFSRSTLLALPRAQALLIGEQHDATDHPSIHQQVVDALISAASLEALVIEMSELGSTTLELARDASELEVQQRLKWNERAWNWSRYGPAIMTAVRAGIEVAGANLARQAMSEAMQDDSLDRLLAAPALEQQRLAIRDGHCDLLPQDRIAPMTRIQIARDRSMARAVQARSKQGRQVVLLAGAAHVERSAGVPRHWQGNFSSISVNLLPRNRIGSAAATGFDLTWITMELPEVDHCAELRRQFPPRKG